LIYIKRKFEIKPELLQWLVGEMESELDSSEIEITTNNLKIIAQLGVETYNIDIGLLKIMNDKSFAVIFYYKLYFVDVK
jgi:hypothetical protein